MNAFPDPSLIYQGSAGWISKTAFELGGVLRGQTIQIEQMWVEGASNRTQRWGAALGTVLFLGSVLWLIVFRDRAANLPLMIGLALVGAALTLLSAWRWTQVNHQQAARLQPLVVLVARSPLGLEQARSLTLTPQSRPYEANELLAASPRVAVTLDGVRGPEALAVMKAWEADRYRP